MRDETKQIIRESVETAEAYLIRVARQMDHIARAIDLRHKPDRHSKILFVSFFRTDGKPPIFSRLFEGDPIMQILSTDTVGLILTLAEFAKSAGIPLSKGPFLVDVQDPSNTVGVAEGSGDQITPTGFLPNGTGNTGTVTVTVTDTSITPPLVSAPASFDVIAPTAPPPVADQLVAGFAIPATPVVIPPAAPAAAAKKV